MRSVLWLGLSLLFCACGGVKSKLCGGAQQPCCTSGVACDTGNACDSTQTCVACGGVGQRCCDGQACGSGSLCSTGNACVACGAAGQPCCAGDSCQSGLSCAGQSCSAGCVAPCTLGASRCSSGGGIETCSSGGACPAWQSILTTCPNGTSCQATGAMADCVELCPVTCTVGALQCATSGLESCVLASGASCPTLNAMADDPSAPQCVTGAQDGTSLVWESPTPLNTPLVAIAGELNESYWVLDDQGNIIHNDLGNWVYELRATEGKRMRALASCGLGSNLFAAGEGGTVYRRSGGSWTEQNVGASVDLAAIVCDSAFNAYAAGADGKLYVYTSGWAAYSTGFTGSVTGLGYVFFNQTIALVGAAGQIVSCSIASLPPTCAAQASNTTENLLGAWGDTYTGHVFAVGTHGTLLEHNGTSWSALDTGGSTSTLRAVSGYNDSTNNHTVIVAVGDNGAYFSRLITTLESYSAAPMESLSAVLALDATDTFVTSTAGAIWFSDQPSPPNTVTMTSRGGKRPISQTLAAVSGLGQGRLFAVGQAGARYRRENATWLDDGAGLGLSEDLAAVTAISASETYAAGAGGRLLVRRYGNWSDDAPGLTSANLEGLAFDETTVYAVGAGGVWLEKPRTGGPWAQVTQSATTEDLWGITVVADGQGHTQEVVAVGSNCTVLSKKNGAFSVLAIAACPGSSPLYAAAVSGGELYVAGDPLLMLHRTGSGWAREFLSSTSLEKITALVPQGSTLWAIATRGEVYQRVNSWAQFEPALTGTDLFGGTFDADNGLFIVGGGGLIWRKP